MALGFFIGELHLLESFGQYTREIGRRNLEKESVKSCMQLYGMTIDKYSD